MTKKYYLTTPIYYTNQAPHIGTAYTTIAADILARYYRQQGEKVLFLTGTDEHGEKIAQAAKEQNKSPQEFVDQIVEKFKQTWQALNISYDDFIRTTQPRHQQSVNKFINLLNQKGAIYQDDYQALYCQGCEDFIFKKDLVDGKCPYHDKEPELIKEKNYFFKLQDYLPQVKELIQKDKILIQPQERKKEVLGLLKEDLGNLSVSRQRVTWGIPVPFDKKQCIYVWMEALQNYISAIGYGRDEEKFNQFWPADLHLIGKDILKFHAIFWPALLLAVGLEVPKRIFAHGFFTVNGQKMSKSLANVVDPVELVNQYGADVIRYYILREIPFGHDGDFSIKRLKERYTADLANGLGNLVSRVLTLSEKVKARPNKELTQEFNQQVQETREKYQQAMKQLKFNEALEAIWKLISYCDEFIEQKKPWELIQQDQAKAKDLLANLLFVIQEINSLISCFLPETAAKIEKQIKENKKGEILFPRLEE